MVTIEFPHNRTITIENLKVLVSGNGVELLTLVCQDIVDRISDISSPSIPNPNGYAARKLIEQMGCGEIVSDDYEPDDCPPGTVY